LSEQIVRRACDKGIDRPCLESWESLADIAELNVLEIFQSIDPETGKGGLSKHIRIRTDAVDTQPSPLEILNAGNLLLADNVSRHAGLALADHDEIFGAAHDCPRRGKSADDPHIRFSGEQGGRAGGTGSDKDKL